MVDWLSNLQFWKKHYHLVAKFPSYSHFLFFSATTLSGLHLSWLWKFQSWQSRLFHRWNWCGKSRLFYQKGNLLKNNNNPSKYKKDHFQNKNANIPRLAAMILKHFSPKNVKFVNQSQIDTLKAYSIHYTGSPFQYQNGYWDLLLWYCICPTQPIFTNTETAMLSSVQMISSLVSLRMRRISQAANIWECCWKDQSRLVTSPISLFLCSLLCNEI